MEEASSGMGALWGILGGAAGLVGGYLAASKQVGGKKQAELTELQEEIEKLRNRNNELEEQAESLRSKLTESRKKVTDSDDAKDDMEDELDQMKQDLKHLQSVNNDLQRELREYKSACEDQEAEIILLKRKLGEAK